MCPFHHETKPSFYVHVRKNFLLPRLLTRRRPDPVCRVVTRPLVPPKCRLPPATNRAGGTSQSAGNRGGLLWAATAPAFRSRTVSAPTGTPSSRHHRRTGHRL